MHTQQSYHNSKRGAPKRWGGREAFENAILDLLGAEQRLKRALHDPKGSTVWRGPSDKQRIGIESARAKITEACEILLSIE